jgi:hypothetical protein
MMEPRGTFVVTNEVACELLDLSVGDSTEDWDDDGEGFPRFKKVFEDLIDTSRWSNIYYVVYEDLDTGKYWGSSYSVGATECQDESAYENDGDEIEFNEVFRVTKTVTVYE